ncbi:ROK family transcriptional regulator [Gluconacetobacter liquefaciens NRIC 0522]|uniref:MarR family transcriptional regulator n=1 Tax=Gluconacetobacter liquefaciens TaxID=89584 RepID=A0A370G3S4_GLULI|nr:ROK family transcriptional regulator [Gluconacetobacter liquefaciens]MBB2186738.1 ROK family transcriptional regulator [Gluconacetobacter liquefaciens]RDI37850.1 MarR family transcriptional regulator [Gluconacetobacter liquefaciens]GBQ94866.1 ROK family transcriptional regulator [Gluconacetobacter liquefaciens NRIC 0522]
MTAPIPDLIPSERRVLELVRRHGAISRARLSPLAQVTPSTLTRVAGSLLTLGLVREGARHNDGRKGVPEQLLELDPQGAMTYGLSIGYNHLHLMALDFTGRIILDRVEPTRSDDPQVVVTHARSMLAAHRPVAERYARVLGLGIALPGAFTEGGRRRLPVPGIEQWGTLDITRQFAAISNLPIYHDNDANAAALAEALFNRDLSADGFAYVYLTNGVGGALVEGGRVRQGHNGNAGEFGMCFPRNRSRPSAEDFAIFLAEHGHGDGSTATLDSLAPPETLVDQWVERAGRQLARLLDTLIWVMDPAQFVIGGTLPLDVRRKLAAVLQDAPLESLENGLSRPAIHASSLNGPVALGAASLPLSQFLP